MPQQPFFIGKENYLKLVAVDLDGSLLTSKNNLTDFTKNTLIKASKIGHKVVIITGRDYYAANYIGDLLKFKKYGGLISSSNGSNVYSPKENKTIINHTIDYILAREIISYGKNLGFDLIIYHDGKILAEKKDTYSLEFLANKNKMSVEIISDLEKYLNFPVNKILFTGRPDTIEKNKEKLAKQFENVMNPIHAMPQFLDLMPKGINKGKSILEIADYYKIDHKDTYAFGDEVNDIEMIKMAGVGVAMGNASDYVKKHSDFITKSNDDDGIAHFVNEYIIKE